MSDIIDFSQYWIADNTDFRNDKIGEGQIQHLRMKWDSACHFFWKYGDESISDEQKRNNQLFYKWFHQVLGKYKEIKRKYHTLMHLMEMFCYLDLVFQSKSLVKESRPGCYEVLIMATFFHDVIYDPKSSVNEDDSAKLYLDFVSDIQMAGIPEQNYSLQSIKSFHESVFQYIIATKHHLLPKDFVNDYYLKLFLDIDMSVLAKNYNAYLSYACCIREEYIHVDHDTYCSKRSEILTAFLSAGDIFHTDEIKQWLESRARSNIQLEINMLKKGCIPNFSQRVS